MSKPLRNINNDYELHYVDKYRLQYVILRGEGEKKVAAHYKEKYGIEIVIAEHDASSEKIMQEFLYETIHEVARSLKDGEAKGLVFTSKLPPQSYSQCHANPYIIAKQDDQIIVVNFQNTGFDVLKNWMNENNKSREFAFSYIDNYDNQVRPSNMIKMQKDLLLCGTFAVNILKQSLRDQEILKQVFGFEPEISLTKIKLGQGIEYLEQLSEDEQVKYVRNIPHLTNLASWYKAHCYARKVNPEHMEIIDKNTKNLIEDIDRVRKEYKVKNEIEPKSLEKLGGLELANQP